MAKQVVNMRLDRKLIAEAKKVLGEKETTATVETALRNLVNNRKMLDLFRSTAGKSKWKGFKKLDE